MLRSFSILSFNTRRYLRLVLAVVKETRRNYEVSSVSTGILDILRLFCPVVVIYDNVLIFQNIRDNYYFFTPKGRCKYYEIRY